MIKILAHEDAVTATFFGGDTEVSAEGASLTEAVENLVMRFKALQEAALEELHDRGFIRVAPQDARGEPS